MYKRSIEAETTSHTIQMMDQVKNHIEVYFREMDNIVYYLSRENAVVEFMRTPAHETATLASLELKVKSYESLFEKRRPEIAGILIVGRNNAFASNTIERIARDPLTDEEWYKKAVENPDTLHLISHPIGRNIKVKENLSSDELLSFVKSVKDPASGEVVGVILIDVKLDFIRSIVEAVSFGKSGFIFIMDELGEVVYSPVNPIVYRIKGEWFEGFSGSLVKSIFNLDYHLFYNTFPSTGWRIVGVIPLKESLKVVSDLQLFTVIIALVTLFIAFVASWFFTNSIVHPIGKLRNLMRKVEEGELHLRFQSKSNDEIGQLGNSFNKMVDEIENLIKLVYIKQKEKREAELKALQAQIKPHFLYNTLDTIQWMAQDHGAHDIVEMIVALTNLFRISLSKGNEIIPITEELRHVESYLIIQMARYENKLDYAFNVPDEIKTYSILKIILQPLVENAIYHGIKPKQGKGTIRIGGYIENHQLVLTVEDDGVGIPHDKLIQLRNGLKHPSQNDCERGYGLFSVNERIILSHGPEYGISIDSVLGRGTTVKVRLPLIKA